jgi:hypothetical protein
MIGVGGRACRQVLDVVGVPVLDGFKLTLERLAGMLPLSSSDAALDYAACSRALPLSPSDGTPISDSAWKAISGPILTLCHVFYRPDET